MKHALKTEKTKDGIEGTLSLHGELTIGYIKEGKGVILEALQGVDTLHLDMQAIDEADVSLIQLICAAHRECSLLGKKITLYEPGIAVGELLCKAGYCKQKGCAEQLKAQCLWGNAKLSV